MADLCIGLDKREITGKKVANLRRTGITPIHMYGAEIDSMTLQCESVQIDRLVLQAGTNIPVTVSVSGNDDDHLCFVREIQYHPVTEKILHVDFIKVSAEQKVRVEELGDVIFRTGGADAERFVDSIGHGDLIEQVFVLRLVESVDQFGQDVSALVLEPQGPGQVIRADRKHIEGVGIRVEDAGEEPLGERPLLAQSNNG